MKYGIPSLIEFSDVKSHAAFCAEHGFRFVELNMTYPWFQSDTMDAPALRAARETYGVELTLHLHDQVNPFEFSTEMRIASIRNILWAVELAGDLHIERITMHLLPGMYSAVNGIKVYLNEHCLDRYLKLVKDFRDAVTGRAAGGTVLCIENTSGYQSYHKKAVELLLESPAFGLTYDIGHDAKIGNMDEGFIMSHADRIRHFHIHDRDGKANHLAFGDGVLDIPRYVKLAESLGSTVLCEVKESGAIVKSKAYLEDAGLW